MESIPLQHIPYNQVSVRTSISCARSDANAKCWNSLRRNLETLSRWKKETEIKKKHFHRGQAGKETNADLKDYFGHSEKCFFFILYSRRPRKALEININFPCIINRWLVEFFIHAMLGTDKMKINSRLLRFFPLHACDIANGIGFLFQVNVLIRGEIG